MSITGNSPSRLPNSPQLANNAAAHLCGWLIAFLVAGEIAAGEFALAFAVFIHTLLLIFKCLIALMAESIRYVEFNPDS